MVELDINLRGLLALILLNSSKENHSNFTTSPHAPFTRPLLTSILYRSMTLLPTPK